MGEGEVGFPTCLSTLYCLSVGINQVEKYVHGPLLLEQKGNSHLTSHSTNSRKEVVVIVAVVVVNVSNPLEGGGTKYFLIGLWSSISLLGFVTWLAVSVFLAELFLAKALRFCSVIVTIFDFPLKNHDEHENDVKMRQMSGYEQYRACIALTSDAI